MGKGGWSWHADYSRKCTTIAQNSRVDFPEGFRANTEIGHKKGDKKQMLDYLTGKIIKCNGGPCQPAGRIVPVPVPAQAASQLDSGYTSITLTVQQYYKNSSAALNSEFNSSTLTVGTAALKS